MSKCRPPEPMKIEEIVKSSNKRVRKNPDGYVPKVYATNIGIFKMVIVIL
jgi:hypothetical protein